MTTLAASTIAEPTAEARGLLGIIAAAIVGDGPLDPIDYLPTRRAWPGVLACRRMGVQQSATRQSSRSWDGTGE